MRRVYQNRYVLESSAVASFWQFCGYTKESRMYVGAQVKESRQGCALPLRVLSVAAMLKLI